MTSGQDEAALVELGRHLAARQDDSSWISRANADSLRALQVNFTEAALGAGRRARLRFSDGSVMGTAAPAHLLLKFVNEMNEAVVASANRRLSRPHKSIDDAVRARLGLWIFAAQPGSVVFDVASPPLPNDSADVPLPGAQHAVSVTDLALGQVLLTLQVATEGDSDADALARELAGLGSSAIAHINRLAARSESGDFIVQVSTSGGTESPNSFTFRPRDASFLRAVIRSRELDKEVREVVGWITTASRRRSIFDIESDDGEVVSGSVPQGLRPEVAALFDKRVIAQVEERADASDPDGGRVKRRLLGLVVAPDEDAQGALPD